MKLTKKTYCAVSKLEPTQIQCRTTIIVKDQEGWVLYTIKQNIFTKKLTVKTAN